MSRPLTILLVGIAACVPAETGFGQAEPAKGSTSTSAENTNPALTPEALEFSVAPVQVFRYLAEPTAYAVEPGRQRLALAGRRPDICLVDIKQRRLDRVFSGGGRDVTALSFSVDGQLLAAGNLEGRVTLWNAAEEQPLWTQVVTEGLPITAVQFTSGSQQLVVGDYGRTVRRLNLATGEEVAESRQRLPAVICSPLRVPSRPSAFLLRNGQVALPADPRDQAKKNSALRQPWEIVSPPPARPVQLCTPAAHSGCWVTAGGNSWRHISVRNGTVQSDELAQPDGLGFDLNTATCIRHLQGRQFALGFEDGQVRIVTAGAATAGQTLQFSQTPVAGLVYLPAQRSLVELKQDGQLVAWPLAPRRRAIDRRIETTARKLWSLASVPETNTVIVGGDDGVLWSVDLQTGQTDREFSGYPDTIDCVTVASDGLSVAVGGWRSSAVGCWRGEQYFQTALGDDEGYVRSLRFSADSDSLLIGTSRGRLYMWNPGGESPREIAKYEQGELHAICLLPDSHLATAHGSWREHTPGEVRIWKLAGGELQLARRFTEHQEAVRSLASLNDGDWLVSIDQSGLWTQDHAGNGLRMGQWPTGTRARCVAVSHNEKWLAIGVRPDQIQLWDIKSRTIELILQGTDDVFGIGFSLDDQQVVAVDGQGAIAVWDVGPAVDNSSAQTQVLAPGSDSAAAVKDETRNGNQRARKK